MPIKVACSCGQSFAAPDNLAGRTVKCPKCSQPLSIPAAQQQQPAAPVSGGVADLLAEEGLAAKAGSGPQCPSCGSPMPPHGFICVGCGYNVQVGRKIDTADPLADAATQGAQDLMKKASKEATEAPKEESEGEKLAWAFVMSIFLFPLLIICGVAVIIWGMPIAGYFKLLFGVLFSGQSEALKLILPVSFMLVGAILLFVSWLRLQLLALEKNRINGILCLLHSAIFGTLTVFLLSLITAAMFKTVGDDQQLVKSLDMSTIMVWRIVGFFSAKIGMGLYVIVTGIIYWRYCMMSLIMFISGLMASITGECILWFLIL